MIRLHQLRRCLEGTVPAALATCDASGIPNISYLSQVEYVDDQHVALSYQFFNKTRTNILANPQATVLLSDPVTLARYRLALKYLKTEETGPLFERMKARLACIASATQMESVFHLKGADLYQVMDIEQLQCATQPEPVQPESSLLQLRNICTRLRSCETLESLSEQLLALLAREAGMENSMLLMADRDTFYTLNSHGYATSGIGSEVPKGCGLIGTAACYNTVLRLNQQTAEYNYLLALQHYQQGPDRVEGLESHIRYPGLPNPQSQIAVPLGDSQQVLAVLFAESNKPDRFNYETEDMLTSLAAIVSQMLIRFSQSDNAETIEAPISSDAIKSAPVDPLLVEYYPDNQSLFIDHEYLIKGVAGAVLWYLLNCSQHESRYRFTNRELRMTPNLGLPDWDDNLETRLILLRKRLKERKVPIQLQPVSRGCFDLILNRPLKLDQLPRNRV